MLVARAVVVVVAVAVVASSEVEREREVRAERSLLGFNLIVRGIIVPLLRSKTAECNATVVEVANKIQVQFTHYEITDRPGCDDLFLC